MRAAALSLVFLAGATIPAQIVLKPANNAAAPLRPKTLDLDITIRKGVAESKFDYVFANEGQFRGEADFMITIPENGVVTGFAYYYLGEKVVARVTEKERARDIYKAITTRQRDPALIEMVGKNLFRVKVFPVEANADLRVELKMVQALPSTPGGAQLLVPMKRLGRLEKFDLAVAGDGPFASSVTTVDRRDGKVAAFSYASTNATIPDLKITAVRTRRPFVADLRAARSGGTGGFFALTLTSEKGMARPKLSFAGVTVKDVMGVPRRMLPGKAYTVVGRYENVRPGAKMFLASGGARFSEALDFSAAPEPNGPATKLWAWAKINSSNNRKEIVGLSVRHTVPSPHTSWIAIPKAERARFDYEIRMGDLARFGRRTTATIEAKGIRSPEARQTIAAYRAKAKSLGFDPRETRLDLYPYAERVGARWRKAVKRGGENSAAAKAHRRDLETLAELGVSNSELSNFHYGEARDLAGTVYRDRLAGRTTAAAKRREATFRRHARLAGYGDGDTFVYNLGEIERVKTATEIAALERANARVPQSKRNEVARRERASGLPLGGTLASARRDLAYESIREIEGQLDQELRKDAPDVARLRALGAERRRALGGLPIKPSEVSSAAYQLQDRVRLFVGEIEEGKRTPEETRAFRTRIDEMVEAIGEEDRRFFETALTGALDSVRSSEQYLELRARRDREEIAKVAKRRENLQAAGAKVVEPSEIVGPRDAYVTARHQGQDRPDLLREIRRGNEWSKLRGDVLETLTELDRLDARPLSAQEERTKTELERRAKEIAARLGDPIVTFDAPEDAIGLTAVMPDGTRLPMAWVSRNQRWEARFDIPAGTPDGPFAVTIDGAYPDGLPVSGRAEFLVDSRAPSVKIERDGTILVLRTDLDVVRATAFGPDGTRREMVRREPGVFALRDAPEGEVRVVATDKAHNRSDMAVTDPLPKAEVIDPALNVQALASFEGRLWISTLDSGGYFEGGEVVPEVGLWPRQAATVPGALYVRAATGEVWEHRGGAWTRVERDATTLAAAGETLLVGIVGGWIERPGNGSGADRRVHRPADLAGRVVTCLLVQGDRVWVGTQGRGVYEWDRAKNTGRWHDERHGLTDDWITALGTDDAGRIVAGTFVGGASVLSGAAWTLVPGTEGACVTAILGDRVATRRGIYAGGGLIEAGEAQALAPGRIGWRGRIALSPR